VRVDTTTALENVKRMAERSGMQVHVEAVGDEFRLTIGR
jgi:hypothetical protein